jgi:hypothetical protein
MAAPITISRIMPKLVAKQRDEVAPSHQLTRLHRLSQRASIRMLRPTAQPDSRSPCRKAA